MLRVVADIADPYNPIGYPNTLNVGVLIGRIVVVAIVVVAAILIIKKIKKKDK